MLQLEEKSIDLEGTRAQLRIIETKKFMIKSEPLSSSSPNGSPIRLRTLPSSPPSPITASQVSTPSMKAMTPLAMDEIHNNSSTESAHDQSELDGRGSGGGATSTDTPRRRAPSKIPLPPGTKGYLAPKPPSGRIIMTHQSPPVRTSPSGPASNRSLSKSTGSLIGRSGPNSVTKRDVTQRPESALSMRKDSSLSSRSSSIPVSSSTTTILSGGGGSGSIKMSPMRSSSTSSTNSPVPKPKRESLTSRVRNMDSLTRIQATASPTISYSGSSHKSYSKKDLAGSFSTAHSRNSAAVTSVRRVSSASVGRGSGGGSGGSILSSGGLMTTGLNVEPADNGKVPTSKLTRLWNMFKV